MDRVLSPEADLGAPSLPEAGLGALESARGRLPLARVQVRGTLRGPTAQVALRQTFVNAFDAPIEASYVFPLPDRAAVVRCRMEVAGRVTEAVLRERAEARRAYRAALSEGKRAALAEEDRPGCFTVSVGNLLPGETATIELTWAAPLAVEDGEATFRLPLVVAPRYVPGAPLPGASVGQGTAPDTDAAPDASRISPPVLLPGFPSPVALDVELELHHAGAEPEGLRSSLHTALVQHGPGATRIRLQPGERLDRDFILRFPLAQGGRRAELLLAPDAQGEEGTWQLTLLPPEVGGERARDVVFLLDRSGSMEGWKIVAARRALASMVDSLSARDRFSAVAFADGLTAPPGLAAGALHPATDRARTRAVDFLAGLAAEGGTEMERPFRHAAALLGESPEGRERLLVLVTDGQVANEDQLLRAIADARGVRVLAIGIDRAVNEGFLRRLAELGGGAAELVESEERLDAALDRLHRLLRPPALSGLGLAPEGLELLPDTAAPVVPPAGFAGVPVVVRGRYRGRPEGALHLSATRADGAPYSERVAASVVPSSEVALSALWARARLRALEDQYAARPARRAELQRQLVETSLRFGVLCRFTAYVAVDAEVVAPGGPGHQVQQPVEPVSNGSTKADEAEEVVGGDWGGPGRAANRATKTQAGTLRGKLHYLSPEQVRGVPLSPRSEVFALGVLLFELATGERPFAGESDFESLMRVTRAEVPWEHLRSPEQLALEPILRQALAASPGDRFANAGQLADALSASLAAGRLGPSVDLAGHLRTHFAERIEAVRALRAKALALPCPAPGEYALVERLGVGGMAEVWLALRAGPSGAAELVVVRRLLPYVAEDTEFLEALVEETGPLVHPGVVLLLDAGMEGQSYVTALEYVEGIDLGRLIQLHRKLGQPVPVALGAQVIAQVGRVLAFANTQGVLQRQLEPDTVLLSFDGAVKVLHAAPPDAAFRARWSRSIVLHLTASAPPPSPVPIAQPAPASPGLLSRVVRFFGK